MLYNKETHLPLTRINTGDVGLITENNYVSPSLSNWRTYNDGDSNVPLDGTGGSPNVTFVRDSSAPLNSTGDYRFTKGGSASRRGQGVSVDFTVENRHLGKVLQVVLDYELVSGTLATDDLRLYVVQDPNGTPVLVEPVNTSLQGTVSGYGSTRHVATFQTHVSLKTYRLCLHVRSTSALDYTVDFSNFKVGEPAVSTGAVITDWQSYTPTITQQNGSVIPNIAPTSFRWRRNGSSIEIQGRIGGPTGSLGTYTDIYFSLPSGITGIADGNVAHVGTGYFYRHGSTAFQAIKLDAGSTFTRVRLTYLEYVSTVTQYMQFMNTSYTGTSSDYFYVETVPIQVQGWGSSVAMSSDTGDGRVVAARYISTTNQSVTADNSTLLTFDYLVLDTHSIFNTSNYRVTVPVSGFYEVSLRCGNNTAGTSWVFFGYKVNGGTLFEIANSTGTTGVGARGFASDIVYLKAGDFVEFFGRSSDTTITSKMFYIYRISAGSQVLSASETVAASYYSAATQTSLTTQINFGTRVYDTHGAVTTGSSWRFTAPMSGYYRISGVLVGTGSQWYHLFKGGILFWFPLCYIDSSTVEPFAYETYLLAGDFVDIRPSNSATVNGGVNATTGTGNQSWISISRVGL